MLCNADGGEGRGDVRFSGKKTLRWCKVQFICITRGWVEVRFPEIKCYVTLARNLVS